MYAEQAVQIVYPKSRQGEKAGTEDLDGKLLAVAHTDKVVGNARQVEQRHAAGKQQKLRKQIAGIERGNAVAVQQAESIDKAESKQGGGENDTPPNRGIALLCILRSSGMSKSFLRRDINRIRGIRIRAITADIRKVRIIK